MKTENTWKKYEEDRNECVRILRNEKRNYERDIIDKCRSDAKLFHRHIRGKMKKCDVIMGLKVNDIMHENVEEMVEVMNQSFQTVFTLEGEFYEPNTRGSGLTEKLSRVEARWDEIMKLMENLDVNKATGPDGVSN